MLRRQFLTRTAQTGLTVAAPSFVTRAWAQEGVNAKTITIGSSAALTGPLGVFGQDLKLGIDAAMNQINAKGGVHGRALQLRLADDGYAPARTAENVKAMLGDGSVFALLSCMGTANNAAILPMVEDSRIPYVAPITGASSLRKAPTRNVFHVRASYTDEAQRLVAKLLEMGISNVAVVYMDNPFGKEVLSDLQRALADKGIKPAAAAALATDGKNLDAAVAQTLAAKPAAVLLGTAGAATTGLVAALRKSSPMMPIAGLSVAMTSEGIKQLGTAASGLAITMVFPDANRTRLEVVRDYQSAMRSIAKTEFTLGSLEGYINTRLLAEGLQRAGRDVSRDKLRAALASIHKFDLGGFNLDYSAAPYVGSKYVDLGIFSSGGKFAG
jgi:branched-chain amino acid transport system substrate-binding protein